MKDPLVAARFVIGYVWPALLTLVFSSGLIGPGVSGGIFFFTDPTTVKTIFAAAALAGLLTVTIRRPVVIIASAGVISLVCLGRGWNIIGQWIDLRDQGVNTTTFLVGAFVWAAMAVAHLMFSGALLALVNADRKSIE